MIGLNNDDNWLRYMRTRITMTQGLNINDYRYEGTKTKQKFDYIFQRIHFNYTFDVQKCTNSILYY